jgi:IS4 transposase
VHDVNLLDQLTPEAGAFYVMGRGYLDFQRLYRWTLQGAFFVTRARKNFRFRRLVSHPVDKTTGVQCDQTMALVWFYTAQGYPARLRRIRYWDAQRAKRLVFLTNNFTLPAKVIADLYRCRWQVELFFKWIKQHLRIKAFYGTSENAVKTQVWIAVCSYLLVAIVRKRLDLRVNLYTMLQILSVSLFEKMPINQAFLLNHSLPEGGENPNQLRLLDF